MMCDRANVIIDREQQIADQNDEGRLVRQERRGPERHDQQDVRQEVVGLAVDVELPIDLVPAARERPVERHAEPIEEHSGDKDGQPLWRPAAADERRRGDDGPYHADLGQAQRRDRGRQSREDCLDEPLLARGEKAPIELRAMMTEETRHAAPYFCFFGADLLIRPADRRYRSQNVNPTCNRPFVCRS
jgi:hypothetical protein